MKNISILMFYSNILSIYIEAYLNLFDFLYTLNQSEIYTSNI